MQKIVVYMLQLLVSKYFPVGFEIKPVAQKMTYTHIDQQLLSCRSVSSIVLADYG
jgi:hypothetical protein